MRYNQSLILEFVTLEKKNLKDSVDTKLLFRRTSDCLIDIGPCNSSSRFRSYDGRCNNLKVPENGARLVPLIRIFPADYSDGISKPTLRSKIDGRFLPNVRSISNVVHGNKNIKNMNKRKRHSLMLMQWGQFLDHDISFTPSIRGLQHNRIFDCRACNSALTVHPACFPILIPKNDPFFPTLSNGTNRCISFVRSTPGQTRLGKRQQLNQNSGLLDSSHIYGSSSCINKDLRSGSDGKLKVLFSNHYFKPLMPMKENVLDCQSNLGMCFHAGDDRSNEQPGLTALHTLFVRQHNLITDQLKILNPKWSDEKIFQEVRKIIIALNQQITYGEFLPRILGPLNMNRFKLNLETKGYSHDYNPECSADIFNEFSTAAFRFGHTLVAPVVQMVNHLTKNENLNLKEHFNNPDVLRRLLFFDELISGLINQGIEDYDTKVDFDLRNKLFREPSVNASFIRFSGMDLAALNLQRGRDHGLRGYTSYRNWCKPKNPVNNFKDLRKVIKNKTAFKNLASIYRNVEDIDLFAGALSEPSVSGGIVGDTLSCIIGLQFSNLRKCDRFWYETSDDLLKFTENQLKEIRKVTLSSLICNNYDNPQSIQRMAMDLPSKNNSPVSCEKFSSMNLIAWIDDPKSAKIENDFCVIRGRVVRVGESKHVSPCVICRCKTGGIGICETKLVTSCHQLFNEVGKKGVLSDESCWNQCGKN